VVVVPIKVEWKQDQQQQPQQFKPHYDGLAAASDGQRPTHQRQQFVHNNRKNSFFNKTDDDDDADAGSSSRNLTLENVRWSTGFNASPEESSSGSRGKKVLQHSWSADSGIGGGGGSCDDDDEDDGNTSESSTSSSCDNDSFGSRVIKVERVDWQPQQLQQQQPSTVVVPFTATPPGEYSAFQIEGLNRHNVYREKHGVPELELDQSLCSFAQQWADRLAATRNFDHRPNNDFGENLYSQWATRFNAECSATKAVESWYEENQGYDYGIEPTYLGYGHFTQMVWRGTTRIGLGRAKSADGKRTIIVANYDPPGNYVTQYVQNVLPPIR